MTIYSDKLISDNKRQDEINCDGTTSNFKPKNVYVFPGGGVSAIRYAFGAFQYLNAAGLLVDKDGNFNKDNMFVASSGGTLPTYMILICIYLGLSKEPNWFEKYVVYAIDKINSLITIGMYVKSQIKSLMVERFMNGPFDDFLYMSIHKDTMTLVHDVFINKMGFDFLNSELTHYFKFNYVKVINGNQPYMTDNNSDLTGMLVTEQIKHILLSSCSINGLSYVRFFQNNDSAMLVSNYVNCISSYLGNPYIRNVFYYSLTPYDTHSYSKIGSKNTILGQPTRDTIQQNYFLIHNIESECKKVRKNFLLVSLPNKYKTIQKCNVELYNNLQQRINYAEDTADFSKFSCYFYTKNSFYMRKIISLFGYYETYYILNELNVYNKQQQTFFKNMDYDFINSLHYNAVTEDFQTNDTDNAIHLKSIVNDDDITKYVGMMKYTKDDTKHYTIFRCFYDPSQLNNEQCADLLIQYLIMMKGFASSANTTQMRNCNMTPSTNHTSPHTNNFVTDQQLLDKYQELYPVDKGTNRRVWRNPEKCLSKDYRRVSRDIIKLYFPSFLEFFKNVFIP